METALLIVCLVLLVALFMLLRYESHAERGEEHGELLEPLKDGLWRGFRADLRKLRR